jgi:hypothetical protein
MVLLLTPNVNAQDPHQRVAFLTPKLDAAELYYSSHGGSIGVDVETLRNHMDPDTEEKRRRVFRWNLTSSSRGL